MCPRVGSCAQQEGYGAILKSGVQNLKDWARCRMYFVDQNDVANLEP
jgi:hypothetical protein